IFIQLLQMRGSSRLLLISLLFFLFSIEFVASKTHIVYWNASNPLFKSGDYEINVRLGDQIKMICPQVRSMGDDDGAYLIIHKDSEMAHMNCVLETPRQVAVCNNPIEEISSTTTVRRYRSNSFGIEFEPGMTHYFLSTSRGTRDPDGMYKKMEGMCKHDHMRMKVLVDDIDPATVVDVIRPTATSIPSTPSPSRFSIPIGRGGGRRIPHEQRRHTKKEHEVPQLEKFSESDITNVYTYHTTSAESAEREPASGWDAVKMNADEMVGDLRGGYVGSPDYIISEHSSSAAFSLVLLSLILLITLR
ncbi:hypothetical protein PMAYCL1PPCAC_17720, partial [Pristionchus mayeri]